MSLASGAPVQRALEASGYRVIPFDPDWDVGPELPGALTGVDAVFNALHGKWGEDGNIQGILNFAKVPYTHSGVLASSLAMDKPLSKIGVCRRRYSDCARCERDAAKPYGPKATRCPDRLSSNPVRKGHRLGVKIVMPGDQMDLSGLERYGALMAEEFVAGRETDRFVSCKPRTISHAHWR